MYTVIQTRYHKKCNVLSVISAKVCGDIVQAETAFQESAGHLMHTVTNNIVVSGNEEKYIITGRNGNYHQRLTVESDVCIKIIEIVESK